MNLYLVLDLNSRLVKIRLQLNLLPNEISRMQFESEAQSEDAQFGEAAMDRYPGTLQPYEAAHQYSFMVIYIFGRVSSGRPTKTQKFMLFGIPPMHTKSVHFWKFS